MNDEQVEGWLTFFLSLHFTSSSLRASYFIQIVMDPKPNVGRNIIDFHPFSSSFIRKEEKRCKKKKNHLETDKTSNDIIAGNGRFLS